MARSLAGHRRLPLALGLAAIVVMLPALSAGLFADDLVQRLAQFPPAELPPRILETGLVPNNSGQLGSVLCNLFGFLRGEEAAARAKDYGIAPWWAHEAWKAALFRPLTAFTHWLDYRLFPNTPALMHAHNIAWYALAVFLAATVYRQIAVSAAHLKQRPRWESGVPAGLGVAGLAACLFLLDKNSYGPVLYVANRGFFIALVFGLLCLQAHLRWRITKKRAWMALSVLCLLLSLLANEGGASTLAFLGAYALVLEPGGWRARLSSLVPAAAVVLSWRTFYVASGYGVRNFVGYIDPGYTPLLFLKNLLPRVNGLLGGQLSGLPPEIAFGLSPTWQTILAIFFAGFTLACAVVFLPALRRDLATRFWGVSMLLALVPASTVAPLSKNLAFVALGAFGMVSSFLAGFATADQRTTLRRPLRAMSWGVAVWLVVAHFPAAVASRIGLALVSPYIAPVMENACTLDGSPDIGERDVVVVNAPAPIAIMLPFDRAYRAQPLPRSIRNLIPGFNELEVTRTGVSTLIVKTKAADVFECPPLGPLHLSYACKAANRFLFGERTWKPGERVKRKGFVAEIIEVSAKGTPRSVAFHFAQALESEEMVWLFFDWRRLTHSIFVLPQIGETVELAGPS